MSPKNKSTKGNTSRVLDKGYFIEKETILVRSLLRNGVKALNDSDYTNDGIESYYHAFFLLSIGIERFSKLIIIADHSKDSNGQLDASTWVKSYGHDIISLFEKVNQIASNRELEIEYEYPDNDITNAIIENLEAFAKAGAGRYANYECMKDPNMEYNEPIRKWWNSVGQKILKKHYENEHLAAIVGHHKKEISRTNRKSTTLPLYDEVRNEISDISNAYSRSVKAVVAREWACFYTLNIVRWLSNVYYQLINNNASDQEHQEAFENSRDHLKIYIVNDHILRTQVNS